MNDALTELSRRFSIFKKILLLRCDNKYIVKKQCLRLIVRLNKMIRYFFCFSTKEKREKGDRIKIYSLADF